MSESRPIDNTAVDLAMNRVLDAERRARESVADCEREAEAILAHAEARREGET